GRRCLEVLGLPLPARIKRSHLIGPLLRITMLHRRLAVKSEAPPIAQLDAQTAAILSCLADMWGPAFWLDENLTGLVVLTLVRLSLSRGNVGASAIGYASYGVFLSTVRKRHRAGQEVCRLGVRVAESAGDPVYTARARFMYASFFGPRDEPVRNALTTFRELVNGCLQCGEYPYAGAAANMFLYYLPVVGLPLLEVESGIREMLGVARHTEQNRVIATVEILRRWIATLEGRAELAEPSFSFDLSGTAGRRNENERGLFHLFEISLLYLLEDYEGAMRHIDVLPGNQMLNGYFGVYYAFFAALVLAKRGARQQPRGAWWRAFRRHRRLVSGEATQSPRNYAHKDLLLAAVEAQIRGRDADATRLFEAAIADARQNGFLQNAAIAAELAGEHADRQGQATAAKRHFRQARLWFHQWGALVKTASIDRRLDDRTGERISTTSSIVREESWPSNASVVLEAARVLSSETDPARLVQRLMTSIVEHTRATRGVLLMREAGELIVTCEIRGDRSSQVCSAAPTSVVPDIPFTIVNY